MKCPGTASQPQRPRRARSTDDGWSFRHPSDPPLSPRLSVREARDAVYKAVTEMNQRGALDAGNGDVLDAWIDSLRPQWIAHHVMASADSEAAAQLAVGEYEAAAAAARAARRATKGERDHTRACSGSSRSAWSGRTRPPRWTMPTGVGGPARRWTRSRG